LEVRAEINLFNCKKLLSFNLVQDKLTHHSITPLLHYSNWGEASKFFDKAMDILILFCPEKPGPLGQVRDQWLCPYKSTGVMEYWSIGVLI
jgi:hypothetical protein